MHRASLIAAFGILFEPINKTIKTHKRVGKNDGEQTSERARAKKNKKNSLAKRNSLRRFILSLLLYTQGYQKQGYTVMKQLNVMIFKNKD